MDIICPSNHDFPLIKAFIKPYEEMCVLLASYVRRRSDKIYVIVKNKEKVLTSLDDIIGVLYVDSTLFHCIPNLLLLDSVYMLKFILKLSKVKKIKCISGEADGTDFFLNLFKVKERKAYQINDYRLMVSTTLPYTVIKPLAKKEHIIRCTENDMDELLTIQRKYIKEEVAPKGKSISDLEVAMSLRQILRGQLCLALFSNNEVVAKANTNAIGIDWIQIGGVYTHPFHRRKGYALHLVCSICRRAVRLNKQVSLFVKEKNIPAIRLYKKIGFDEREYYKIAYFN